MKKPKPNWIASLVLKDSFGSGISRCTALRNWAEHIAKGYKSTGGEVDKSWREIVLVAREVLDEHGGD